MYRRTRQSHLILLSVLLLQSLWRSGRSFNPPRPKSGGGGSFLDPFQTEDQWYILPKKRSWVVENPLSAQPNPSRLRLFSTAAVTPSDERDLWLGDKLAWYRKKKFDSLQSPFQVPQHGTSNYFKHALTSLGSRILLKDHVKDLDCPHLLLRHAWQRPRTIDIPGAPGEAHMEQITVFQLARHDKSEKSASNSKSRSKQKKKNGQNRKPNKNGKKHKPDDDDNKNNVRNKQGDGTYKGRWDSNGPDAIRLLGDLHSGLLTMDTTGAQIESKYPSLHKKWGGRRLKKNWSGVVSYYQKWKEGKNTIWTESSMIKAGLVIQEKGEVEPNKFNPPLTTKQLRDSCSSETSESTDTLDIDHTEKDLSVSGAPSASVNSNILERRVGTIQKPRVDRPINDARYDWYEGAAHRSSPEMERYLSKQQQSPVEPNGAVYQSLDAPPPDEKDEDHGEAMLELAYFEARGGRISRAEETFRSYVEAYPSASSYLRFAKFAELDAKNVGLARSIYASMVSNLNVSQIRKPKVIEQWAAFEERYGQFQRAAEIRQLLYYGDAEQLPTIVPKEEKERPSAPTQKGSTQSEYKVSRVEMPKKNDKQNLSSSYDMNIRNERTTYHEEEHDSEEVVEPPTKTLREEFFQGSSSVSDHQKDDWWDLSSHKANMSREMYNNQQGMKEISQTLREEFFRSEVTSPMSQWGSQGNDFSVAPGSFGSSDLGGDWQNPSSSNDSNVASDVYEESRWTSVEPFLNGAIPKPQEPSANANDANESEIFTEPADMDEPKIELEAFSKTEKSPNEFDSDEGYSSTLQSELQEEQENGALQSQIDDDSFGKLELWDGTGLQMDLDELPSNDPNYGKEERWNGGGSLGLEVDKDTHFQAIGSSNPVKALHHHTETTEASEESKPGWSAATHNKFRGGGFLKTNRNVTVKRGPLWSRRLDHSDADDEDLFSTEEFKRSSTKKSVLSFLDEQDFGLTDSGVQQGLSNRESETPDSQQEEAEEGNSAPVPFFLLAEEDLDSATNIQEEPQTASSEQKTTTNNLFGFVSSFFSKLAAPSLLLNDREVPYADEEAILNALAAIENADSDDAEAVADAADAILKALEDGSLD